MHDQLANMLQLIPVAVLELCAEEGEFTMYIKLIVLLYREDDRKAILGLMHRLRWRC